MKNSRSPTLVLQSGRVGSKPLWFLAAPFLDFITVGSSILPTGISESPSTDFSIQQQQSPMRERLQLWICVCSGKCQLADPEEKIRTAENLGISALRSINYFLNHKAESCLCLLLLLNSCWQWHADYEMC